MEEDDFNQVIGYLLDIEAKTQSFIQNYTNYPNLRKILEIRLEGLNNASYVQEILYQLGFEFNPQAHAELLKDKKFNQREQAKQNKTSLELCERRILRYLGRCILKGQQPPNLPQMIPFP
jgi:hypothetical protein